MALSSKQKKILDFIGEESKRKRDIVEEFRFWYFCNSSKHIGDILSRMVKRGLLLRVQKGVFTKGRSYVPKGKNGVFVANQGLLF